MPKGSKLTQIPNGQTLKVEWHLGYAHKGGFKIELLDSNEKSVLDLTNGYITGQEYKFVINFLKTKFVQ